MNKCKRSCLSAEHTQPGPGWTDRRPPHGPRGDISLGMRGCGTLRAALWWLSQPETPHKAPKEVVCSGHTGLLLGNLSRLSLLWCLRATSCFQAACSHRLQTLNSLVPRLSAAHLLPQGVPWDPSAHRSPCAALSFCFPRLGTPICSSLFIL